MPSPRRSPFLVDITPLPSSVANTVKRAMLIWISILFFGNKVSVASCFGTGMVVAGVFFYNYARRIDAKRAKVAKAAKAVKPDAVMDKPELAV